MNSCWVKETLQWNCLQVLHGGAPASVMQVSWILACAGRIFDAEASFESPCQRDSPWSMWSSSHGRSLDTFSGTFFHHILFWKHQTIHFLSIHETLIFCKNNLQVVIENILALWGQLELSPGLVLCHRCTFLRPPSCLTWQEQPLSGHDQPFWWVTAEIYTHNHQIPHLLELDPASGYRQ